MERAIDKEVSMVDKPNKNKEVDKLNYNDLPHNNKYSF